MASIAQAIAIGLLKGAAGKVGAQIVDEVFQWHPVPKYFDEVYKEIAKIVKQEVEEVTIEEVNADINGVKDWIREIYTTRKASKLEASKGKLTKEDKTELHGMLLDRVSDLTANKLGRLQADPFAEPGLGVFMVAAGLHLSLLQELAFVDPDTQDPNQSSYADSVKTTAQRYALHATATFNSVTAKRLAFITGLHESGPKQDESYFNTWDYHYEWRDEYTGLKRDYDSTTHHRRRPKQSVIEKAEGERADHIVDVTTQLNKTFHNVTGTVDSWNELLKTPLPDPNNLPPAPPVTCNPQ